MPSTLAEKSCTPCRGGVPPLTSEEAARYLAQAPEWGRFAATVRMARERLGRACGSDPRALRDAATALAAAEERLAAGLDWLKEVRPAFADLYAQLDERQRALLDTRFRRGHGHR